jgi:allantoin racemase
MTRILVINPNSSRSVTEAIAEVAGDAMPPRFDVDVRQIDAGPPTIEGDLDEARAAPLVIDAVWACRDDFDAFVIACHGDPGLHACREAVGKTVVGIGEASMLAACAVGNRFGIITLSRRIVGKKWRQVQLAGVTERCAAIIPAGVGVLHASKGSAPDPYIAAGREALSQGADVLILGCAGMTGVRLAVAESLHVTVIDPVIAGAHLAAASLTGGS